MVVGARTIKSYGWENHYLQKIRQARFSQFFYVFYQGIVASLGFSFFQNGGMVVLMIIFINQWKEGEKLDQGVSMSIMAMIYFIFISVNSMTYWAMTTF